MLRYNKLDTSDQSTIDKEIRSNYNTTAQFGREFEKVTHEVHLGIRCSNCFRLEKSCCCDKITGCLELEEDD